MGPTDRYRAIRRVLLAVLLLNWAVSGVKFVLAHLTRSLSVRADAFHSLLDGASSVIGLLTMLAAAKEADREHPYGHRKFEVLGAMGIGVLLMAAAYSIFHAAVERIHGGAALRVDLVSLIAMAGTIAVNVFVTLYERRRGTALGSELLLADSSHTRADVAASAAVLVSLVCARLGIGAVDLAASALIAVLIAWTAWRVASGGIQILVDRSVLDAEEVARVAREVSGVRECHAVRTRGTPDAIFGDVRIHVDRTLPLAEAHAIAHRVEARLREKFPGIRDLVVHVEPHAQPHA